MDDFSENLFRSKQELSERLASLVQIHSALRHQFYKAQTGKPQLLVAAMEAVGAAIADTESALDVAIEALELSYKLQSPGVALASKKTIKI
jgi:hypothetical protein